LQGRTIDEDGRTTMAEVILGGVEPDSSIMEKLQRFFERFEPVEQSTGLPIRLWFDACSKAFYFLCHLDGKTIAGHADVEAVLDPQESEEYKLNRGLYLDKYAYLIMERDAKRGRSFEDIVVEFDESYRPKEPLKVFGGQHRVQAIKEAMKDHGGVAHGLRVYLGLTSEQKVEIATISNTSIVVSNDVLDRMQEDLLGGDLREWCQRVGLLEEGQNFADKRSSEGIPTVRVARTFLVNFYAAKDASDDEGYEPHVCKSGVEVDSEYLRWRDSIDWSHPALEEAGRQFAQMHHRQRERVLSREEDRYLEFAIKAIHPSVVAAWASAAGLFQRNPEVLQNHYALSEIDDGDPLNASALSKARLKLVDPDTYRGLGARISPKEVGRMLEVFLLQAKAAKRRGITKRLANIAIKSYVAKRATREAEKAKKRL